MAITVRVGDEWADFGAPVRPQPIIADAALANKAIKPKRKSTGKTREDDFAFQCHARKLPTMHRQHLFAKSIGRRWQFDFAFPQYRLAVEIEGLAVRRINGIFVCTGRHTTPAGFEGDCEKYANAVLLGWTVVRFMTKQVPSKYAIEMTMRILMARGWQGANHAEHDDPPARAAASA